MAVIRIKTEALTGIALDWAVAQCERGTFTKGWVLRDLDMGIVPAGWACSTDWLAGGPIIEREWLDVTPWPNEADEERRWSCEQHDAPVPDMYYGPTPLIAAMRCYVASKIGLEVEIPEELK